MRRTLLATAAAAAIAVSLAGCGGDSAAIDDVAVSGQGPTDASTTTTTTTTLSSTGGDRVEVVESGWSTYGYPGWSENFPDRYAATFGLLVRNPTGRAAQDITVRSRFVDAAGDTLGAEEVSTAELLLPGQAVALGRSGVDISAGDPVGHEVIGVEVGAWHDLDVEPGGFEVTAEETVSAELGSATAQVSGHITSTFASPVTGVEVTALFRDGDGSIIGATTFADPATYAFQPRVAAPVITEVPDATGLTIRTTEVHPRLTVFDLDDLTFLPPPPDHGQS